MSSAPRLTKSQKNRVRKADRATRKASRECVQAFRDEARAVVRCSVLTDDSSVAVFDALPTDAAARMRTLAPTAKPFRAVIGLSGNKDAMARELDDASRAPIGSAEERLQLVRGAVERTRGRERDAAEKKAELDRLRAEL